tara:strand:+ start:723 stop:1142 length:420 start_codon:yes stop_codon:yes gene_type:complete
MKVDLTKAIEAHNPETGEVVPMKLGRIASQEALNYSFTTEMSPSGESNPYWRADGTCCCGSDWKIRNVRSEPEFTDQVVQEMWGLIQDAARGQMITNRAQLLVSDLRPTPLEKLAKDLGYSAELLAEKMEACGVRLADD